MRQFIRKALDIFFLLRIPLLAPVWTILLLGWITGSSDARPGGVFLRGSSAAPSPQLWIILAGFSMVVASIYVVNQIMDIESDRINHKLFLLPHGFVSVRTAWVLAVVCAASGLAISLAYDKLLFGLFIASLILGILYNLPPARLKNRALGGVVAAALGHGMLTFLVGWYTAQSGAPFSAKLVWAGIISGISPSLANGAVFLATTVPDAAGDRLTGKRTFCVRYGEKRTAIVAALLCTGAFLTAFAMEFNSWVMSIPSAISLFLFVYFAISTQREMAFKTFKWPVFLLSAFIVLFVPEYGVLIVVTFLGSRLYYKWRFNIEYPTFKSK